MPLPLPCVLRAEAQSSVMGQKSWGEGSHEQQGSAGLPGCQGPRADWQRGVDKASLLLHPMPANLQSSPLRGCGYSNMCLVAYLCMRRHARVCACVCVCPSVVLGSHVTLHLQVPLGSWGTYIVWAPATTQLCVSLHGPERFGGGGGARGFVSVHLLVPRCVCLRVRCGVRPTTGTFGDCVEPPRDGTSELCAHRHW